MCLTFLLEVFLWSYCAEEKINGPTKKSGRVVSFLFLKCSYLFQIDNSVRNIDHLCSVIYYECGLLIKKSH